MELQQLKIQNLNVETLEQLFNSVTKVDKSTVLELNSENISIQSALETKSATKFVSRYTNELLETEQEIPTLLFPFADTNNLIDALKLFSPSAENRVTIEYATLGENMTVVDNFTINENDGTLVINIKCSDISDVIYLDDSVKNGLTDEDSAMGQFELNEMTIKKAINIFGLDSHVTSAVSLFSEENNIFLKGHNYDYKICEYYKGDEVDLTFQKKYLNFVEKEFSEVFLHDNRIIFKSMDTDTQTVIAVSEEVNEDYV